MPRQNLSELVTFYIANAMSVWVCGGIAVKVSPPDWSTIAGIGGAILGIWLFGILSRLDMLLAIKVPEMVAIQMRRDDQEKDRLLRR